MKPGDVVWDVEIDGVDDEGRGRANVGDWDLAVRGAVPPEVVHVRVERVFAARTLAQCVAFDFEEPSDLVVDRACPHPGPCAGCPLEGVSEAFALELKRTRVERAFADVGLDVVVGAVEPSRGPRQKVKLTASGGVLGLYVPHSHALVDASRCPHQHPAITSALARVQPLLANVEPKAVVARAFVEGVGVVILAERDVDDATWSSLAALVDDRLRSIALRVDDRETNSIVGGSIARRAGPSALTPLEGGPPASVDAFCQTDPALATFLYERAARFLVDGAPADAHFVDAYAGAGGFSRALLGNGAKRITAIERASESAVALRALSGIVALESSVEEAVSSLANVFGLVVDPPKKGLAEAAAALAALGARRVALVACDPDAGARDAKVFIEHGYRVVAVEPLDLFPATPEVETLICLIERDSNDSSSGVPR